MRIALRLKKEIEILILLHFVLKAEEWVEKVVFEVEES